MKFNQRPIVVERADVRSFSSSVTIKLTRTTYCEYHTCGGCGASAFEGGVMVQEFIALREGGTEKNYICTNCLNASSDLLK